MAEPHFCGCCGNQIVRPGRLSNWCGPCRKHVLTGRAADGKPPWDRTYFAQHGEPCPYEEAS